MKLTDKAYKEFSEWLYKNQVLRGSPDYRFVRKFQVLPEAMQWGVIQDWADSLGIEMWVEKAIEDFRYWYNIYKNDGSLHYNTNYDTRQEARNAAIEKLNEIINKG